MQKDIRRAGERSKPWINHWSSFLSEVIDLSVIWSSTTWACGYMTVQNMGGDK